MSEAEIRRLRADLDVMEQATGLRLQFGWPDVWLALALGPSGAALSAWAAYGPSGYAAWGLVPLLVVALCGVARWLPQRRERHELALPVALAAGFAVLILWERWLGLPTAVVRGAGMFFVGVMCIPIALSSRNRRLALAATVSLAPYGLALPLLSHDQRAVVGGAAVVVAGLAAAAIMAWQLRAEGRNHGIAH